jgi:SAM-dependent methyltransferase
MTMNTLVHGAEREAEGGALHRPPLTEWLLAMGPVVHRLDYGGRVAALGCIDPRATALLAAAYPLATLDAVDSDAAAVEASRDAIRRVGAGARCELEVGDPDLLAPGTYDLVCLLHGLGECADPVRTARAALRAVRPTGALMVVEHSRSDAFFDGPITVGGWLQRAGVARVRLAAATPHGFVLDARPTH